MEKEKYQCVFASCTLPTGYPACNPRMCPRLGIELETLLFTGSTQSTEPCQLWPNKIEFKTKAIVRDKEGHYIMIKGTIQ